MTDLDKIEPQELVEMAEQKAKLFKDDGLKTNQIRNFFAAVSKMRQDFENSDNKFTAAINSDLILLKPKLAYAAGRQLAVKKNFQPFISEAIDAVIKSQKKDVAIENFFSLIEAIVAYHKFYGGKDN